MEPAGGVESGAGRDRSRSPEKSSVRGLIGHRPLVNNMPFVSKEHLAISQRVRAQAGDVFISTFPKTGTTWMQQVCHQLRTGGHTDFDEISEDGIVPWLEVGPALGQDVTLPQVAAPRCFKTHQTLKSLSHLEVDGARFLCIVRDPAATFLSYFKFSLAHGNPSARSRDINVFVRTSLVIPGGEGEQPHTFGASLWEFYAEFWQCRNSPNVKVIVYESMRNDLSSQLDGVAEFMGLPAVTAELRQKVLDLCSMEWMASHDVKFDDHHMSTRLERMGKSRSFSHAKKVGLEVEADVVAKMTPETLELLEQKWQEIVTPVTGHANYRAMAAEL